MIQNAFKEINTQNQPLKKEALLFLS